ncbi:pyridoxamine 5'-phosphate oxidase family protein [Rhizobium tibeticum]|uniref:pyridoxamine 5'-phosphate oxidase family protein n=1 Tax=Rhizobium tibeticum TaxID=501024 RepID=UPI0027D86553|nr:pyridoxamine 5'-phosphate oxidase family protein [Rhizobium tibeticum]
MTERESRELLARGHVGHLACVHENRPYVVPVNYAFDAERLYVFSLAGQKIDWLRSIRTHAFRWRKVANITVGRASSPRAYTTNFPTLPCAITNASMPGLYYRSARFGGSPAPPNQEPVRENPKCRFSSTFRSIRYPEGNWLRLDMSEVIVVQQGSI